MTRSPFPGMDPYLESPSLWPDVHSSLMTIFREQLTPFLVPKYVAELNTQIVIDTFVEEEADLFLPDVTVTKVRETQAGSGAADVAVAEPVRVQAPISVPTRLVSMYIRQRETERLVAVIELLSPINKRRGDGRTAYLEKRAAFLKSRVHLIEIDFLRKWPRMPLEGRRPRSDYCAVVSNFYERPSCMLWPIGVRQRLPTLPIPLLQPDPDVPLDLGAALNLAYERARYDLRIDYRSPCEPPLGAEDSDWAVSLRNEGVRPEPAEA